MHICLEANSNAFNGGESRQKGVFEHISQLDNFSVVIRDPLALLIILLGVGIKNLNYNGLVGQNVIL